MKILRLLAIGLALVCGFAQAQPFSDKSKPVRMILPQGPGSASDVLIRAFARAMSDVSGLNVVVEYKPGAETLIGVQALMSAPPDGYTIMMTSSSTFVLNPVMMANLPYDSLRDFIPIAALSKVYLAMNLGPSTSFKTAKEFFAAARANPGKYSFGTATATSRLAGELLQTNGGMKLLSVPYKTTAAAMTGLAAGEVDVMFADATSSSAFWQGGRVRAVAIGGPSRLPGLPQLPTVSEEGVPDYESSGWFATFYAAKTPPDVVSAMREIQRKALKTPLMAETMAKFSMVPMDVVGEEVNALTRKEIEVWRKVVRAANIQPQ